MVRRIAVFLLTLLLLTPAWTSAPSTSLADSLSGRLLLSGRGIDLFDPATGEVRRIAERGNEPVFYPSGETFAYIREGGCYPNGPDSCYTEYAVFEKSLSEVDPAAPGRQVFGWTDFFVRAVDVAPGGRLVFSAKPGPGQAEHGKTLEIYSMGPAGGSARQLTHNHVFDNDPVVSPDGRKIAFARKVHGRGQIFTMGIDGDPALRLTHDDRRDRLPSWSPDGRRLVFISQPAGASRFPDREIYTVGAGGGRERRLTHNTAPEARPNYSPDGRAIAFLLGGDVWLMGAGGAAPHRILTGPGPTGYEGGLDWGHP